MQHATSHAARRREEGRQRAPCTGVLAGARRSRAEEGRRSGGGGTRRSGRHESGVIAHVARGHAGWSVRQSAVECKAARGRGLLAACRATRLVALLRAREVCTKVS